MPAALNALPNLIFVAWSAGFLAVSTSASLKIPVRGTPTLSGKWA
jgi:hypothetical protein